jgi:hypothetical protein
LEIARRFNPAMAMPNGGGGPWPVAVRYTWGGGSDLQARTVDGDGKVLRAGTALANAELDHRAWGELPVRDENGNRIEYWIDGPGDDRVSAPHGISDWRRRWREAADRTPTQYAHMFWLNRARGELVIQYWFFYPFNEWLNHHEGDWEHVNVVVSGPSGPSTLGPASDYRAVGYEFYFHGRRLETDRVMHAATPDLRPPRAVREGDAPPRVLSVDRADRVGAAVAAATNDILGEERGMSVAVLVPDVLVDEISAALGDAGIAHSRATTSGLDDQVTVVPISVAKGLEIDAVVVVEPARIVSSEMQGMRALYVALTRPTQRLTIVHSQPLPTALEVGVRTIGIEQDTPASAAS